MRINPTGKDVTNVDIIPLFPKKLVSIDAYHDTPVGRISVAWERTNEQSITKEIEAAKKLHGKIILPGGYKFADGSTSKLLTSGNFLLSVK